MISLYKRNNGVSLIEVMIALIVVSLGILGLAKFQTELTRNAASTKIRTAALALAEQKLEDLRSFSVVEKPVDGGGNIIEWDSAGINHQTDSMAFNYVEDNEGGRLCPLPDTNNACSYTPAYQTGAGEQLSLSWDVTAGPIGNAKEILVTVAWDNLDSVEETVELSQILSATNPGFTTPLNGDIGTTIDPPTIVHNPGEAPEVVNIDINTGEGIKKETSKPLPDVYHTGDYNRVEFEVVTYDSVNGNTILRREQFINVNCLCESDPTPGVSYTPAYTVFENGSETIRDARGVLVSKDTGVPANNQQPTECSICCRDHTEPASPETDPVTMESITYGDTNYTASGTYPEYCRMKYVNGILSVFQDWNLKAVSTFPDYYVEDGADGQDYYRTYVQNFVKDDSTDKSILIDRDITVLIGGNQATQARGIYIDTVYNASASSPSYADFVSDKISNNDDDTLQYIPFFEVNLTKLANWTSDNCTDDPGGTGPCVTSQDIVDEGLTENNYSRGLVTVDAGADDTTPASSVIAATVNQGNSGIVGQPVAGSNFADSISATVGDSSTFFDVSVQVTLCSITGPGNGARKDALFGLVETSGNVSYSGDSAGNCDLSETNNNSRVFTCSLIPVTDTVDVTVSGPTTVSYTSANNTGINELNTSLVEVEICDY